jgi:hypothetical protein
MQMKVKTEIYFKVFTRLAHWQDQDAKLDIPGGAAVYDCLERILNTFPVGYNDVIMAIMDEIENLKRLGRDAQLTSYRELLKVAITRLEAAREEMEEYNQ